MIKSNLQKKQHVIYYADIVIWFLTNQSMRRIRSKLRNYEKILNYVLKQRYQSFTVHRDRAYARFYSSDKQTVGLYQITQNI